MAGVKSEFGYMQEPKAGLRELPGGDRGFGMVKGEEFKNRKSKVESGKELEVRSMRDRQTLESVMMEKDESKKRKISTYRSYECDKSWNLG